MKLRYYLILIFCLLAFLPVLLFRAWPHSTVPESELMSGIAPAAPAGGGGMVQPPPAELQVAARSGQHSTIPVLLIGVAGALGLALILSVVAARPLEDLTATARRIARGNYAPLAPPRLGSMMPLELRQLHAGFREMVVQLRKSRARIHRLAFQDRTTGLPNRECFRRRAEAFLDKAAVGDEAALFFVDLDGFKEVNDTLGHDVGDDVLGQVGARLKEVVGGPELSPDEPILKDYETTPSLARLGGDEFAVFLPNAGAGEAGEIAKRILGQIEVPYPSQRSVLSLGASIGIALMPGDALEFSGLLKCADIAMYEAKRRGKNQVQSFAAAPPVLRDRRQQMVEDLFSSEVTAQIETHFQPVYRAEDMSLTGVEALIRWQHPKYGLLTPRSFFEMVADLGLGRRIDDIAFERSVGAILDLSADRVHVPEMSFNLPVERLAERSFVSRVLALHPLPFRLGFELTESTLADDDMDQVHWALDQLREAGVYFELDDFGSPRGSVCAMFAVAPRRIKLDQRLTRDIHRSVGGARLVASLVRMAHDLQVEVVAKGVERVEQIEILSSLGADHLQGFALNRPLSAGELSAHLHAPLPSAFRAS